MRKIWAKKEAVSPVIAVILMVAITVVLAAVLYIMVSGMITGTRTIPHVTFSTPSATTGGAYTISVAGVDRSEAYGSYKVALFKDGAQVVSAGAVDPTTAVSENDYTISYTDTGGEGKLTGGDVFKVEYTGTGSFPSGEYELKLIWADTGDVVGSITWTVG